MDQDASFDIPEITPTELKTRIDGDDVPVLVDVREPFERDIADLPELGQIRIPVGEVAARMGEIPKDREVVFYCRSGMRSEAVARLLKSMGYEGAVNLSGGVLAWREQVDPSLQAY